MEGITFSSLLNAANTVGVPLVFTVLAMLLGYKWASQKVGGKKVKPYKQVHHIFPDLEMIVNTTIRNVSFGTDGRNELFRVMLSIKYQTFIDLFRPIYDKYIEVEEVGADDFYNEHISFAQKLTSTYEREWQRQGIPQIVIDKFNEWHSPRVMMGIEDMRGIANSTFHDTGTKKTYAVSDLYSHIMKMALMDGEKALKTLNGQITGLVFNGKVC
jgi:hypothetical protein